MNDHDDVREHRAETVSRFLDIFESATDEIRCCMSIFYSVIQVNHQMWQAWVKQGTLLPRKKAETDEWDT